MPKKTKKAKLLAEYHRHAAPPIAIQLPQASSVADAPATTFTLPQKIAVPSRTSVIATSEFIAIKRDLIKSILLICSIMAVEFLLSRYLS